MSAQTANVSRHSIREPFVVTLYRDSERMMQLEASVEAHATEIAGEWKAGCGMGRVAEIMQIRGIKL